MFCVIYCCCLIIIIISLSSPPYISCGNYCVRAHTDAYYIHRTQRYFVFLTTPRVKRSDISYYFIISECCCGFEFNKLASIYSAVTNSTPRNSPPPVARQPPDYYQRPTALFCFAISPIIIVVLFCRCFRYFKSTRCNLFIGLFFKFSLLILLLFFFFFWFITNDRVSNRELTIRR